MDFHLLQTNTALQYNKIYVCVVQQYSIPVPYIMVLVMYLFRLPPALENKDLCVDILDTDPAGQAERRVCPYPVHHGAQLSQKRDQTKP